MGGRRRVWQKYAPMRRSCAARQGGKKAKGPRAFRRIELGAWIDSPNYEAGIKLSKTSASHIGN